MRPDDREDWVVARFKPNGSTDGRRFIDLGGSQLANAIAIDNTGTREDLRDRGTEVFTHLVSAGSTGD